MKQALIERFWKKVERRGPQECWLWKAGGVRGYGRINTGSKGSNDAFQMLAHRLSYLMANGTIPDGACVLHSCDVRACVNPAHLWIGSRADNIKDMLQKGRARCGGLRGEEIGNAKLNDCDVRNIRAEFAKGDISRASLGKFFGVSHATISRVLARKIWAHLS